MPRVRTVAATALSLALLAPTPTHAHEGNPNYRSTIRTVAPAIDGLTVEVVNGDDSLRLTNRTGEDVAIPGYSREPYARVLADGTVQVNQRSEAAWTNQERDGIVDVPESVDNDAAPAWRTLDRTGRFQWHDHRIHWMGKGLPPQVEDEGTPTKVYDWSVPFTVGTTKAKVDGTLRWVPSEDGGPPTAAVAGFAALLLGSGAAVVVTRRRRAAGGDGSGTPAAEAW